MFSRHIADAFRRSKRSGFLVTKRFLQRTKSLGHGQEKEVIFVAGVQRSGTNMMMSVLERSLDTDVYHETDDRAFEGYEMRSTEVIEELVSSSPAGRVVMKALCELQILSDLLDHFMPAKAIWVLRDLDDVVNSHVRLWTGMPESIRRIVEERDTAAWRGRGMSEETHQVLRKHYHPQLDNPSACALFWYFRNVLYFEQGLDKDARVRLAHYEELVFSPHAILPSLFEFIGLRYSAELGANVFASSVRKATPPSIEPDIRRLCDGLTERFAAVTMSGPR